MGQQKMIYNNSYYKVMVMAKQSSQVHKDDFTRLSFHIEKSTKIHHWL